MEVVDATQINSFAHEAQQADVQPEEPIFVISSSQLQEIISRAIQPLQDRIDALEDTIALQGEKVAALEATQDTQGDNELNMLRLIADLRKKESGKTEITRAEKIEKYLEARPDHRVAFETLRGHLGIDKVLLSQAVKALMASSPGRYTITKARGNRRVLVMLPSVKI